MAGEKKRYILGVDPGIKGALALLDVKNKVLTHVFDLPTTPTGIKSRLTIDGAKLSLLVSEFCNDIEFCIFEDVHSSPNDGVVGAFSFGKSTGILLGVLQSYLLPIIPVAPSVWKNVFGLSSNKDESRHMASRKYPAFKEKWNLKKHDGRAEAALLADFGKRFY